MVQRMEQAEPVQHGSSAHVPVAQPQPAVNFPVFRPTISVRTAVIMLAVVGFVMFMSVLLKLSERSGAADAFNRVSKDIHVTRYENEQLSVDILNARDQKRIQPHVVKLGYVMPANEQILYVTVPDIQ